MRERLLLTSGVPMKIQEQAFHNWVADWWHWSAFFPVWLGKICLTGAAAGHTREELDPLFIQLAQELGEEHPTLLLETFERLIPPEQPSAETHALMLHVRRYAYDFPMAIILLHENERLAAITYEHLEKAMRDCPGVNLAFFRRHIALDNGPHAEGAEALLRLVRDVPHAGKEAVETLRTLRINQLVSHFGEDVRLWFSASDSTA